MARVFTDIPTLQELRHIINNEATRSVTPEKIERHYVDFTTSAALLEFLDIDPRPLTSHVHNLSFVEKNAALPERIVQRILASRNNPALLPYADAVYSYLAEEDAPAQADCIFVFGSKAMFRADKAIELYVAGLSKMIVVSGGNPIYQANEETTEAETIRSYMITKNVPKEAILIENKSITVADNVKRSLNLLDVSHMPHAQAILVNSPFSQRRGWTNWMKLTPSNATAYRVNAAVSEKYSRESWHQTEEGIRVIVNEIIKLKISEVLNTS